MSNCGDDASRTEAEAALFSTIVALEWPDLIPAEEGEPTRITGYRPRRPGPLLPLVGVASLAASLAAVVQWDAPAYQRASGHLLALAARIEMTRDLVVISMVVAGGLVVGCALLGSWVVMWAQYRLRRTAMIAIWRDDQPSVVHRVHPPNIATALSWVLLLAIATTLALWWMSHQFDLLASGAQASDVRTAAEEIAMTVAAWCAAFVVAATGLVSWTARESRHHLRVRARRSLDL